MFRVFITLNYLNFKSIIFSLLVTSSSEEHLPVRGSARNYCCNLQSLVTSLQTPLHRCWCRHIRAQHSARHKQPVSLIIKYHSLTNVISILTTLTRMFSKNIQISSTVCRGKVILLCCCSLIDKYFVNHKSLK